MFEKAKPGRDAFTFSLGGMRTIASFIAAPAIADDQLNKARDAQLKQTREVRPRQLKLPLCGDYPVVLYTCA